MARQMEKTPGPGLNVAILRKQRDMSQVKLARKAGISVSLLSKIEIGDRALRGSRSSCRKTNGYRCAGS
jgi:transcriptional regulator with XRE-family HTH domain